MKEVRAQSHIYSKQRFRLLWLEDPARPFWFWELWHSRRVDYDAVHERVDPEKVDLIHETHYEFYSKIFNAESRQQRLQGPDPPPVGSRQQCQSLHTIKVRYFIAH